MLKAPEARRGQFLWLSQPARTQYVSRLKKRIQTGYYSSDKIIAAIIEKIAPSFDTEADKAL